MGVLLQFLTGLVFNNLHTHHLNFGKILIFRNFGRLSIKGEGTFAGIRNPLTKRVTSEGLEGPVDISRFLSQFLRFPCTTFQIRGKHFTYFHSTFPIKPTPYRRFVRKPLNISINYRHPSSRHTPIYAINTTNRRIRAEIESHFPIIDCAESSRADEVEQNEFGCGIPKPCKLPIRRYFVIFFFSLSSSTTV